MKIVKSLVLTGFGINCEEEMAAAYRQLGVVTDIVHVNEVIKGTCSIHDYNIVNFPGGFSFGDDIASGKVLANKIRFRKLPNGKTLLDELKQFTDQGKYIVGICNGFQVLVRLGMLPNISGTYEQEASLIHNDCGHFIDDWVSVHVTDSASPFLKGIAEMDLPIRHGEGKLVFANDEIKQKVIGMGLNCLTYDENPNGSELDCAGLTDPRGKVLGMMPHPEAFLTVYNHPDWNRRILENADTEPGDGSFIFRNIVNYISNSL